MPDHAAVLDDLRARGLFYQCTDEPALRAHLATPRRLYNGFDPTADSLTIGNLVPIMLMRRFRAFGHEPIVLMGGATGRIGDPSGKDAERTLMTDEKVEGNIAAQREIFVRVLGEGVRIVNNYDWFRGISFLDALRDIGKHFSVNEMIRRDSVRTRLEREGQGISYTEFSYMLLQAYDFLHLYRAEGVTLQTAGADQWGNIVSGCDLVRRAEGHDDKGGPRSFGFTAPLLTKADGGKFGKTESGAVWLSHRRPSGAPGTSPYAYTQFWLNTADADVRRSLLIFTDHSPADIDDLCARHAREPQKREAQRTLAREATALLHGNLAAEHAESASAALFSGEVARLDLATLNEVFAEVPSSEHARAALAGEGLALVDLLPLTTLAKSKREAREHLGAGAITLNGEPVGPDDRLTAARLLHASIALLRRGKKAWHVTRWG
ncbi:MAG TPA: tyrosine--tRNA ligase [Phycisphaerales bacterium]|nr:tyrosine--tRNA ligase [Phycisphaerales bacterium]